MEIAFLGQLLTCFSFSALVVNRPKGYIGPPCYICLWCQCMNIILQTDCSHAMPGMQSCSRHLVSTCWRAESFHVLASMQSHCRQLTCTSWHAQLLQAYHMCLLACTIIAGIWHLPACKKTLQAFDMCLPACRIIAGIWHVLAGMQDYCRHLTCACRHAGSLQASDVY